MARINEMTRQSSRLKITADPVCDFYSGACGGSGESGPSSPCDPADIPVTADLGQVYTSTLLSPGDLESTGYHQFELVPDFLSNAQAGNILELDRRWGTRSKVRVPSEPMVAVELKNLNRPIVAGSFPGLGTGSGFPAIEVTRTGEDLYTEG